MGLDMYLYKSTKTRFDARKKYNEAMDDHWTKWRETFNKFPRKSNGYEIDEEKLTEEDKKNLNQAQREEDEIKARLNFTDTADPEIHYWRKFNALHGFIVNKFADGVDDCQPTLIGGKDGIKIILDALKKTKTQIDEGENDPDNLAMPPTEGFFFGSTDIDDWFANDLKESIDFFEELYNTLDQGQIVYYQASW